MSDSARSSIRNALALGTLFAISSLWAQPPAAATRPDDFVARARQFIRKLYPGLDPLLRPVIIDESVFGPPYKTDNMMNVFTFELRDLNPRFGRTISGMCVDPALSALFTFDRQKKELTDLKVLRGTYVTARRDNMAEELTGHPERSDARITAALNEAGAKYGPDHKAEFLRALPIKELAPFVSGELKVGETEFDARFMEQGFLTWMVEAKWHSRDGREADCTLMFEPFEGRLTNFSRSPFVKKVSGKPGH